MKNTWHRVIVHEKFRFAACEWLESLNVAYSVDSFNVDSEENPTCQFIFNEDQQSDLTCAIEFAKVFAYYKEVRSYSDKGLTCSQV